MRRPLVWLAGEIRTPPFSSQARVRAGILLRQLQRGDRLELPHARPMSILGPRCGELRITDGPVSWRIMYRVDQDAVIIGAVFSKKTQATPRAVLTACRDRFAQYDDLTRDGN